MNDLLNGPLFDQLGEGGGETAEDVGEGVDAFMREKAYGRKPLGEYSIHY